MGEKGKTKKVEIMDPLISSSLLSAGGGIINSAISGIQNNQSRKWQERMWEKTNAYNSPAAQMERLKAAGLNPNLVYGNGSAANTTTAPNQPEQKDLRISGLEQSPMMYQDLRTKSLQNDLLEVELTNRQKQYDLKFENLDSNTWKNFASAYKTNAEGKEAHRIAEFNQNNQKYFQTQLEQDITSRRLNNAFREIENTVLRETQQTRIKEAILRTKSFELQNQGTSYDNIIKYFQSELSKQGVQPKDNVIERLIQMLLPSVFDVSKKMPWAK